MAVATDEVLVPVGLLGVALPAVGTPRSSTGARLSDVLLQPTNDALRAKTAQTLQDLRDERDKGFRCGFIQTSL